jgi:hypothetical protein
MIPTAKLPTVPAIKQLTNRFLSPDKAGMRPESCLSNGIAVPEISISSEVCTVSAVLFVAVNCVFTGSLP